MKSIENKGEGGFDDVYMRVALRSLLKKLEGRNFYKEALLVEDGKIVGLDDGSRGDLPSVFYGFGTVERVQEVAEKMNSEDSSLNVYCDEKDGVLVCRAEKVGLEEAA